MHCLTGVSAVPKSQKCHREKRRSETGICHVALFNVIHRLPKSFTVLTKRKATIKLMFA
jgi:hypothetical protein